MTANVREVDRDQLWLMPPSLSDWLPEDHLAWFVLDVVAALELGEFYADYRHDGRGGAAYWGRAGPTRGSFVPRGGWAASERSRRPRPRRPGASCRL